MMALFGHKLTHTPHLVQVTTSMTCGLRFFPSSRTPCGQTPIQTCPVHGGHFLASIVIGDFCLPM